MAEKFYLPYALKGGGVLTFISIEEKRAGGESVTIFLLKYASVNNNNQQTRNVNDQILTKKYWLVVFLSRQNPVCINNTGFLVEISPPIHGGNQIIFK